MAEPTPYVVADSGDAVDAPSGAVPINLYGAGSGEGSTVAWADVTGKPAVIGAGATQVAARTAIGAGTSSLALGTTATTALAGDTVIPAAATWANIAGKPAVVAAGADAAAARTAIGAGTGNGTSNLALGTTASTAAAGNHTHTFTALTGTVEGLTGANLQAILLDIVAQLATKADATP